MADGNNFILGRQNYASASTDLSNTEAGPNRIMHLRSAGAGLDVLAQGTWAVVGTCSGRFGVYGTADNGRALQGESASGYALAAHSDNGWAGVFGGPVYVDGDLTVTGSKSAVLQHPDGTQRRLYALESPESWFEDFGRAEMVDGQAQVSLDSDFVALVHTNDYHVFLTPEGETQGLYVSGRSPDAFEVREQQRGTSNLTFSYRIVARRADVQAERLQSVVEVPTAEAPVAPPHLPE